MINELRVRDLGVIADVEVLLDEGMTAITGETGAGKTLVVDALELLVGGRSDPSMVRKGARETTIEGRFFHDASETVIVRVVPANGRSRSTINGSLAPLSALEELGVGLVDLYGQHAHQSLLHAPEQRRALDLFAQIDHEPLRLMRARLAELDRMLVELGGDDRVRARELDLLRYELNEIDELRIESPDEDGRLAREQEELSSAVALREASERAHARLSGGDSAGARDLVDEALDAVQSFPLLSTYIERLRSLAAELEDLAVELRQAIERFEEDPHRLDEIRERRNAFVRLKKKHGETLDDVLSARETFAARIEALEAADATRLRVMGEREALIAKITDEEGRIGDARRRAAGPLAASVESHLFELGLPKARVVIDLPDQGLADEVSFLFAANAGESAFALSKVASGGELARIMLALRLVLSARPSTLVFDEVDAGIGGEAALAVGRALRELGRDHQVIVVTHLAQVAAFADNHLVVEKVEEGARTLSRIAAVEGAARVEELARMLSGHPDSPVAQRHAEELLTNVAADRGVAR